MNQEPIPYEKDGKHKDLDLEGWWVRLCIPVNNSSEIFDAKVSADFTNTHSVLLDDYVEKIDSQLTLNSLLESYDEVSKYYITHLLGVDKPKTIHPQHAADLIGYPLHLHNGDWCVLASYANDEPVYCPDDTEYLIEPYDPTKHKEKYEPRPIFVPEWKVGK